MNPLVVYHPCELSLTETTTLNFTKYRYVVTDLIPHTSVRYNIYLYEGEVLVKHVSGLLEGEQYLEWKTDDYLDRFIQSIVDKLGNAMVE
jgi:hypothetical protein